MTTRPTFPNGGAGVGADGEFTSPWMDLRDGGEGAAADVEVVVVA